MKASIWGLLVAALAFGASTIYLSMQLREERAQAEKFAEATRALNARIAELEKAREQRVISGSFSMDAPGQGAVSMGRAASPERNSTLRSSGGVLRRPPACPRRHAPRRSRK